MPLQPASPTVLRARYVLPIDSPPIDGGRITIMDGRIMSVECGPCRTRHTDLGDVAILPGLVNAHAHLDFSGLEAPLGKAGIPLPDWLREVIAYRQRPTLTPEAAVDRGLAQSHVAGTTALGEITTYEPIGGQTSCIDRTLFLEVIAPRSEQQSWALEDVTRRLNQFTATNDLRPGLSPHAPYTVPLPLLESLCRLARTRNVPLAMHLAESREELELLATGRGPLQELLAERGAWDPRSHRPIRPADYLDVLREAPRVLIVHGNYLSTSERTILAETAATMALVYCPRTHDYFRHEPYPLSSCAAMGITLALGTDGRGSNPDLSLLSEARHVHALHRDVAPHGILEMATRGGARALGIESLCGSIRPGKRADLVAVAVGSGGATDPSQLVLAGEGAVCGVWHAGRRADLTCHAADSPNSARLSR
jgi:cytosine/adenosine deaminase-related metal-dependent hydrolase